MAVACRRASPLDATRATRMLRVAVPAVAIDPRAGGASGPRRAPASGIAGTATPETRPAELVESTSWALPDEIAAPVEPETGAALPEIALTGGPQTAPAAPPEVPGPAALTGVPPVAQPVAPPPPAATTSAVTLPAAAARPRVATAAAPPRWRGAVGHLTNVLIAIALEVVVMVCGTMVGLIVTGHHLEEVVTGSMQPTIPIGSLVLTESIPANQLTVGDVVVFPDPNNLSLTIVHRIVWLSHDPQGDVLIKTKGDYNAVADNWTVKRPGTAYADRAIWVIPGGGTAATWLRAIGFFGLLALIIGFIGYQGWRQVRKVMSAGIEDAVPATTPGATA
jgi:signal peptidase